ncbi:MAG TPA: hypothetical protein VIL69_02260 [Roseomonas sp.]
MALHWAESGGPPIPREPERRGFGTRLLTRGIARELGPGASVALRYQPHGLRATICLAAPRANQS